MKYLYLLLTLTSHFIAVATLKLLDNFSAIIVIFLVSLFIGFILRQTENLKELGWGILFGSLTSLTVMLMFVVFLSGSIT